MSIYFLQWYWINQNAKKKILIDKIDSFKIYKVVFNKQNKPKYLRYIAIIKIVLYLIIFLNIFKII